MYEHYRAIQAAIDAAEEAGFTVNATTCCCSEGLFIESPDGEVMHFDV